MSSRAAEADTETEQLPDLSRLEVGNEYTVYYSSQRSGNEVDRTGTVTTNFETEEGDQLVRLHEEQRDCYKHSVVALMEATNSSGDDVVGAYSLTLEAEPPNGDDPVRLGETYTVRFETSRTSLLGIVDRVVREDGPGPYLVTDGGLVTDTGPRWAKNCPRCEHVEKRDHGPGRTPGADRCPECGWPMNHVDLNVADVELEGER